VDTRPLYIDNLTKSITVHVPKYIIKFANPCCFYNLTRSLVVYVQKDIIKYTDNLKIKRSISNYAQKNNINYTRSLYIDNLPLSISVYIPIPKNIILFTSHKKPKVIIELCYANEQLLKDNQGEATQIKNKNIIEAVSLPNCMLSFAFLFSNHFWCVLRCLRWVSSSYTPLSLMRLFVQLRLEKLSYTSLNIFYLNSFLIFGIGLCIFAPMLIYYFTG
jgi:hypothetical protein